MVVTLQTNTRHHSAVSLLQIIICNVKFGHAFAVSFVVVYQTGTATSILPHFFPKPSAVLTETRSNLLLRLRGHIMFKLVQTEIALEMHFFAHAE